MFEIAEVGNKLDKETYREEAARLRAALLQAQRELAQQKFAVVVLVGGVEGAGKSEVVNLLLEWMDARGIQTHGLHSPTEEEREQPRMWRFWRRLPPHGRMGIFFGAWYQEPMIDMVLGKLDREGLDSELDRILDFERMLADEGVLVVKFWLHLSRAAQKKRLKQLERDPLQRWRVTRREWKHYKLFDEFRKVFEHAIRRTNNGTSQWTLVEAADERYRNVTVARTLLEAIQRRLHEARERRAEPDPLPLPRPPAINIINRLDMTLRLPEDRYEVKLLQYQGQLNRLVRRLRDRERSLILVFEGPDAAGKGGAIRRVTAALDARDYQVASVAAPTDEERAHPYLWRFWRSLPQPGMVTIYDRSWYGRVLVERVENLCSPDEWQRAYAEINAFEEQLTDFGVLLVKFWLAITPEEQLERFKERQTTPYKQYKITEEDWRNRAKWDAYEASACEMVEKTSTEEAPWVLVEANNKEWARVKVLRTVAQHLKRALTW